MNGLSCSIGMWEQISFVLSQCPRLTDRRADGRTDRRTERPWQYRALHCMQSHDKLHLVSGAGMGMNRWKWEGMGLKKTSPLISELHVSRMLGETSLRKGL